MALKDDVQDALNGLSSKWAVSTAQASSVNVPDSEDLTGTKASRVAATYLYTDIVDSSGLMQKASDEEVASVMAAFLKVSVRIIRSQNGHIRSFDGDRVMGVFAGPNRQSRAAATGLKINYAVSKMLNPAIQEQFKSIRDSKWELRQMTGIASGDALLVKVGIRNNSDLLSTGVAPNLAAKLSDLRDQGSKRTAIGSGTYASLDDLSKLSKGVDMWSDIKMIKMGGGTYPFRTSGYTWGV